MFCELLKARKNSGTVLLPNSVSWWYWWKGHCGGSHRCTVEVLFWESTWNFPCRILYRGFSQCVCHVLVLVFILVGENRLLGPFIFFAFWNPRLDVRAVSMCVRTSVCQEMEDQNGNSPSLVQRTAIAVLCLFFYSCWLFLVLCLAKIQNRILLMDTDFTVVVFF